MRNIIYSRIPIALMAVFALLLCPGASAQEQGLLVDYVVHEAGDSFVSLPVLSGHTDSETEAVINAAVYADGGFSDYLRLLADLDPLGTGLQVKSRAQIIDGQDGPGVLAVLITASGRIGPGRPGYKAIPLMYDLLDGTAIQTDRIFLDVDAAQHALDKLTEEEIEPIISDYLYPDGLYPVPVEQFLIDESGIGFYYPQDDYTTLSGQSGSVHFRWYELKTLLKSGENDLLPSLRLSNASEDPKAMIESSVSGGALPGLPVRLGHTLEALLEEYPLLTDAEVLLSGETYQPEDARFRGSLVIARDGVITGIVSHRMELWGIITGETGKSQVVDVMGQPESSLTLDEAAAESYGLETGSLDSYTVSEHVFRFNFDSDMILRTVWLSQIDETR